MNKTNRTSTQHKLVRSAKGQTLSLTAATLVVVGVATLLLTALAVNVYTYVSYNSKMQLIADEVAKTVDSRRFFLGARRPQFQTNGRFQEETQRIASDYATAMAKFYSLPPGSAVSVESTDEVAGDEGGVTFTKVTVKGTGLRMPFDISSVFPHSKDVTAIGVASESSEAPPAFIRFGFRLIDPSVSNPSVTSATQVVMLPAYGFQTDASIAGGGGNLGGTANNNDVVGNQPDPTKCLWAGINHSPAPLRSNAPFVTGPGGSQVRAFN